MAMSAREKWSRKLEYFLSVLGFIVGFGNVWRFPYICMINGGGAFLVPYVIFLILCGLPVFFLESILGQFTAKPLIKVWGMCPLFRGLGFAMMTLQVNVTLYYNSILGWILYYMYSSCIDPLPWSHCGNPWNTKSCEKSYSGQNITNTSSLTGSMSNISDTVVNTTLPSEARGISPAEEFWRYKVLQISSGLTDTGHLVDHACITTLICYVIVFFCLIRGIKSVGKVVYVTAVLPYILLVTILIKGLMLPGSLDGVIYYLKPDFSKLLNIQVWIQAGIQVFYSLGPGWGCLITMSSFNKFHNNCLRDSIIMTIAGEGTSIFSGLVIFSVLGFMAHRLNVPVSNVVESGPGLAFVAYPEALADLPLPNVWAFLFFLAMFTVGLDSHFAMLESLSDSLLDIIPMLKKRAAAFRGTLIATFYVVSLVFCTQGGIYFFQLADWYVASTALFVFCLTECIMIGWIYGIDRISRDIHLMLGRELPGFMRICWCFITPLIITSSLVFVFATYESPKYGEYRYPAVAEVFGWMFGICPLVPVIIIALKTVVQSPGNTLKEKLFKSVSPSDEWFPATNDGIERYNEDYDMEIKVSLLDRIRLNTLGNKHSKL